jgi:hypothetical protein
MGQPMSLVLRGAVALGLGYQAYVHADLASTYDAVRSDWISQGDLFRIEAVAALLAAVLVLAVPRWWSALAALAVAGGGAAAVLLYRYVQVGPIGPLPDMSEPLWYREKTWSAVVEVAVTLVAATLVVLGRRRRASAT